MPLGCPARLDNPSHASKGQNIAARGNAPGPDGPPFSTSALKGRNTPLVPAFQFRIITRPASNTNLHPWGPRIPPFLRRLTLTADSPEAWGGTILPSHHEHPSPAKKGAHTTRSSGAPYERGPSMGRTHGKACRVLGGVGGGMVLGVGVRSAHPNLHDVEVMMRTSEEGQ